MNLRFIFINLFFLMMLLGCQSAPTQPPKQALTFIDTSLFDREMRSSLASNEKDVVVSFYNPVTPNQIPNRLEKWLSEVNKTGGKVSINQPAGELEAKDPMFLFGLFSGLWAYFKSALDISDMVNIKTSVQDRNAVIQLARNSYGELYIQNVSFPQRQTK